MMALQLVKLIDADKHVEPMAEDLRTRVRFPPPPPLQTKQATLAVAFLSVKAVWMRTRVKWFDSEMHGCMSAAKAMDGRERPAASTITNETATLAVAFLFVEALFIFLNKN